MTSSADRDAGLRRVSRTTRWVAAGAVVAAAGFSVTAAKVVPGHAHPPTDPNTVNAGYGTGGVDPNAVDPNSVDPNAAAQDPGLQPPAQPPMRAFQPPRVSSGGS